MTSDYTIWEENGRFGLAWGASMDLDLGNLGRGSSQQMMSFGSAEARNYYIMFRKATEEQTLAVRELNRMKYALSKCFTATGRIKRKPLMTLAGRKA